MYSFHLHSILNLKGSLVFHKWQIYLINTKTYAWVKQVSEFRWYSKLINRQFYTNRISLLESISA